MIRLVVNPQSEAVAHQFDKKIVIIGSGSSSDIDLNLPGEKLQAIHVKIVEDEGRFSVTNVANDPFVCLNGLPFGKKKLVKDDLIQIGSTQIHFEELQNKPSHDGMVDTEKTIPDLLEQILQSTQAVQQEELLHGLIKNSQIPSELGPSNRLDYDIEELLDEVEKLSQSETPFKDLSKPSNDIRKPDHEQFEVTKIEAPSADESVSSTRKSLKDDYLKDLEDEHMHWHIEKGMKNSHSGVNWDFLLKVLFGIFFIVSVILGLLYVQFAAIAKKDEIRASRGVADVAMALTHAHIKNIKPQNQNWSDPDFIRNNLTSVLAYTYPSLANFDGLGQFNNCPYILRIYTNSDLSQFLVIAQPAPSLISQSLFPRSSIVLDSNAMEMRSINDLKSLNRLLVNTNTLDGINGVEISNLVRQGELVKLSDLANRDENIGTSPPKALGLLRPGAQNYVYNAPRYYPLGEDLLKKALDVIGNPNSHYETSLIQQEISSLSKLKDIVLYSSEGMEVAQKEQKALTTLGRQTSFLVAYLQFNPNGLIVGSHLLLDDTPTEVAIAGQPALFSTREAEGVINSTKESKQEFKDEDLDVKAPLYLQFTALSSKRQQSLEPIRDKIILLLENETQSNLPDFSEQLRILVDSYIQANKAQEEIISKKLLEICQERSDIPFTQILSFTKSAGLETAIQKTLASLQADANHQRISQVQIDELMLKIQQSSSWEELYQNTKQSVLMLKLEKLPDPDLLISNQNSARSKVIQKLTEFLLSRDGSLPPDSFNKENRSLLTLILKMVWLADSDAFEFYLHEFDLRSQEKSPGI